MNKYISTLLLSFLFTCQLYGQGSVTVEESFEIIETITIIDKSQLFSDWKNFVSDTINPTSITEDLNGDGKSDFAGFFTGIEQGFFIFGNISDKNGDIELLYKFPFDHSWFVQDKFQAIISLVKSGQKITDIQTGTVEKLNHNSIQISKVGGSQFIVTLKDKEWVIIRIK